MAGRPPQYDLHVPFEVWGIWVEAFEHGGWPHTNQSYWVKTQQGHLMVYNSPLAKTCPKLAEGTHLTYLAVEKFLYDEGLRARQICWEAYVKRGYWVEMDGDKMERQLHRLAAWKEGFVNRLIRDYAKGVKQPKPINCGEMQNSF